MTAELKNDMKVFYCYDYQSTQDEELCKELEKRLKPLERAYSSLHIWNNRKVTLTRFCGVREEKSDKLYKEANHGQNTTQLYQRI